jgi:hypothetical protein
MSFRVSLGDHEVYHFDEASGEGVTADPFYRER